MNRSKDRIITLISVVVQIHSVLFHSVFCLGYKAGCFLVLRLFQAVKNTAFCSTDWTASRPPEKLRLLKDGRDKSSIQQEDSLHQQIGLTFKEETSKLLHLERGFVWCWNLYTAESWSEIPGEFLNVAVLMAGSNQLDRLCEKWRSITKSQGGEQYRAYSKNKRRWAGWVTSCVGTAFWNVLLKIGGRIEVTGRQGRRSKQMLDDLEEEEDAGTWKRKH